MSIFILVSGIVLLVALIALLKLSAYLSLLLAALYIGIANRMSLPSILGAVTNGVGNTLGPLVLIIGLGVILGSLLTETGAVQRISAGLIQVFGAKRVKWAMVLTGLITGIAMFYNAGFIVLIPLVFSVAGATGQPLVYLCCAMASALSVTHGFLPPHPGPSAIIVVFHADTGKTLLYGFFVALPALLLAGVVFPEFLKKIKANPPKGIFNIQQADAVKLPGFGLSIFIALVPVLLMGLSTLAKFVLAPGSGARPEPVEGARPALAEGAGPIWQFIGDPAIALLITVLLALFVLGVARGIRIKTLMQKSEAAVTAVASIILVIAAGGVFKQVLTDSGTGNAITMYFKGASMSPLVLGWLVATIVRVSIGSSTVAGFTAAGIVQPLLGPMHVHPELMVLSIGAGSLMCSHVNDTGFWMFKEYLGLSLADTFRSWTVMETIVGVTGLGGVLILNQLV